MTLNRTGESSVAKPEYASPQPSNLNKESVYRLAESIAAQLEYEPRGDLHMIVDKLGGKISYRDFWSDNDSGSLIVESPNDFVIFVAKNTTYERDKFTIAHELGHYVLHYLWPARNSDSVPGKMKANRYGSDRAEWEANWFAAAFLMPAEPFRIAYNDARGDFVSLAEEFGVSVLAAKTRAKALGLSTD